MRVSRPGRRFLPAVVAGIAVLCVLWGCPERGYVSAEDEVVEDKPVSDEKGSSDDASSGEVDPSKVDGLFEVISDQAGYEGESEGEKDKKNEKKLIVGYKQTGAQASIHFEMGEKPSLDSLLQRFPSSLDVYFLGEKKAQTLPVTWESYGDDYSSTNLNYYFFTPHFDSDKYEVKGLNLQTESPYIEVIQDAVTYEMIDSAPPKENEAAVFKFCTEKLGLNTAAACGILANIYCESGFRTNAIGDGGTSVGLCQWHNSRWTNLRNYAPDDWQVLEGQLRFMRKELHGGYRATLSYLQSVTDDAQGAYDAAYYWCMHYEMPDRILSRSMTRGYLARNVYWKRYGLGEDETETEMFGDETEAETERSGDETEAETQRSGGETETATAEGVRESETTTAEGVTESEMATAGGGAESETVTAEAGAESETVTAEVTTESENEEVPVLTGSETEASNGAAQTETEGSPALTETAAGTYRCISDDGLNIREERSTEAEVAGFIPYEGIVTVHSSDGEWAQVGYEGKEGYSKLEFLEKVPEETEKETE